MKFVLLSVVCLIGATLAAPASTKQKRDILPGDPRYGTDYHHNHHHHHNHHEEHHPHENEVQISQALGGYAGSYTGPDNSGFNSFNSFQSPSGSYGPPNYTPGKPIHYPEITSFNEQSSISNFKPFETVETISNGYLSPVVQSSQSPIVRYNSGAAPTYQHHVAPQNNAYLAPVAPVTQAPVVHYTSPAPVVHYTSPAPVVHHTTPAPVVHYTTPAPVVHYKTPAPVVHYQTPAPVVHYETPAPVVHYETPAPVVHYTTPAPVVHYKTPAPVVHYESAAPVVHYTTAAPSYHHHVTSANNGYLAPAIKAAQHKTSQPIDSYGAPVPEYQAPTVAPQVENNDHYDSIVVKSHATATSDESSNDYSVTVAPVQQEVQTSVHDEVNTVQETTVHHDEPAVQDIQAESRGHHDDENHSQVHVQHEAAHTVKAVQEQVSQVHHAAQPAVHYQKTVQPAVKQQFAYQSAPQTFSSGYFGNGFDNFGTFDSSAFQSTFESPSSQFSSGVIPQTYNTDLSNLGFGYQQAQTYNQQFPQTIQSSVELPSFSQISKEPSYEQINHFQTTGLENVQQGQAQSSLHVNRNAQTSSHTYHEHGQIIGNNGGYVY